ncbi:MAG TPA: alpha/beta hydrolase [Gemmata sp.]|nr:alpha/beta hydrolase [Gemmata sp.]
MLNRYLFLIVALSGFVPPAAAQPACICTEDVIYGRRDGHALTMDVFAPRAKANGRGIIICVSAGFESHKEMMKIVHPTATRDLLDRGYVVFAVLHSSQPKYTVPEIVEDIHRAVRFIKLKAPAYKIDPEKIGITGASSGGHLSLMMGCAYRAGNPTASDPVERQSSQVAAVACFFPPTDFVAFDSDNLTDEQKGFRSLFDIREPDPKTNLLVPITRERRREIGRECSPLFCATKRAAPTLIIHGDKDQLVPFKQSADLIHKLDGCGVECKLEVRKGMDHGYPTMILDFPLLGKWFDNHLLAK